jgi:glyoxylase-like metal-dependent hydrolase (beta-lactamase superfamily II)
MRQLILVIICIYLAGNAIVSGQESPGWYTSKQVAAGVWQISDHGADNIYVIEGRDSSMLIDTGLGAADLAGYVSKITAKPLIVINTHGHPDHAGANYQFRKVYVDPADSAASRACNAPEARANASKNMLQGNTPAENELFKGTPVSTRLVPVKDGQIFNLGGRRIQVITTPGHTPGEICLLDMDNKLLFTGDNNNTLVWLFLPNCKPLRTYLASLEKQIGKLAEFTTIFPGHGAPMPSDFINDQAECVRGILNKTIEAKPYKSFAGEAMISTYKRASVAFNPKNL